MTWAPDFPAYVFPIFSCFLFIFGIILLWADHRQRKYLYLDTRLAYYIQTEGQFNAAGKSHMPDLLSANQAQFPTSVSQQGRFFRRFYSGREYLERQMAQAGFTGSSAISLFYTCMILTGMAGGILALNLKIGLRLLNTGTGAIFFDVVFYASTFSIIPVLILRLLVRKRREELEMHVPDLIDLLVLCVGTGLTLEASLRKVAEVMGTLSPVLSKEMKTMLNELKVLPDKSSAFINLQNRTSSDGLKYLFMALYQSEIYGTSVAIALRSVAADNRKRRMISVETTAARLPVLLSLPLMIFILPPVIALSAGPGFILMLRVIGN
ncbi:type II secretion system F family protein [Sneathiella marina]|uniref:Type II secretion system F family protein n=1 Tax=Sneathiella marina TaxID=2950108 RepID=A0ABY4WEH7_9PROT|nr:type II secretion system F family protein [Sneathiella marina]USG63041.1 type II secretion system F family protein [Sneathiella marina]